MSDKNLATPTRIGSGVLIKIMFFVAVGVGAFLFDNFILNSVQVGQDEAQKFLTRQVDQSLLSAQYRENYLQIIGAYLSDQTSDSSAANLAKEKLLTLTVPADYRDYHLRSVLDLNSLGEAASSDKVNESNGQLMELQNIYNQLKGL